MLILQEIISSETWRRIFQSVAIDPLLMEIDKSLKSLIAYKEQMFIIVT